MKPYLQKLKNREDLSTAEIEKVMQLIMSGKAEKEEISEFLLGLREKGATVNEITGAARVMRKFLLKVSTCHDLVLDTCGTGGDKKNTFNISTIAAFVIAGAGVPVAKHGNRSVSSRCGSADILEALGINLAIEQEHLSECLDEIGMTFLFAQKLHPAMKNVAAVRKELKVETIFNILGPLSNPALATHQMVGVYSEKLLDPMIAVLKNLGLRRAMVVRGADGLDEVTTTTTTQVREYNGEGIKAYEINPKDFGIPLAKPEDLKGGDVADNLKIVKAVLSGKKGPHRDIVLFNAACALYVGEKAKDIAQGIPLAGESIDSGRALEKLEALKEFTNSGV